MLSFCPIILISGKIKPLGKAGMSESRLITNDPDDPVIILTTHLKFNSTEAVEVLNSLTAEQKSLLPYAARKSMPIFYSTVGLLMKMAGLNFDEAKIEILSLLDGHYPNYAFDYDDITYNKDIYRSQLKKWQVEKLISNNFYQLVLSEQDFQARAEANSLSQSLLYYKISAECTTLAKQSFDIAARSCINLTS
jgi:hypothetical protein